jgi:hypothetical protein
VRGDLSDEQLHRLEKVAESCPVRRVYVNTAAPEDAAEAPRRQ